MFYEDFFDEGLAVWTLIGYLVPNDSRVVRCGSKRTEAQDVGNTGHAIIRPSTTRTRAPRAGRAVHAGSWDAGVGRRAPPHARPRNCRVRVGSGWCVPRRQAFRRGREIRRVDRAGPGLGLRLGLRLGLGLGLGLIRRGRRLGGLRTFFKKCFGRRQFVADFVRPRQSRNWAEFG